MKHLLILALMLLLQNIAFSQDTGKKINFHERVPLEKRAERQTQIMTDSLGLDAQQIAAINAINLKYIKAREDLMASNISKQEKIFDIETLDIMQHKDFKKALSKEQFKKLQALEERRRAIRKQKFMEARRRKGGN